jgi:hypothetical protein
MFVAVHSLFIIQVGKINNMVFKVVL